MITGSARALDYANASSPTIRDRDGDVHQGEPAINANDDYLNSGLAEDHRAFGYQSAPGDGKPRLPGSRRRVIAVCLAFATVGAAGLLWMSHSVDPAAIETGK